MGQADPQDSPAVLIKRETEPGQPQTIAVCTACLEQAREALWPWLQCHGPHTRARVLWCYKSYMIHSVSQTPQDTGLSGYSHPSCHLGSSLLLRSGHSSQGHTMKTTGLHARRAVPQTQTRSPDCGPGSWLF